MGVNVPVPANVAATTYQHLLFDQGLLIANYDVTKTPLAQQSNWVGATSGGCEFTATANIYEPKIDGIANALAGTEYVYGWVAEVTAHMAEFSKDFFMRALPGATTTTKSGYDQIDVYHGVLDLSAYVNIALVVTVSGNTGTVPGGTVFMLDNAITDGQFKADFKFAKNSVADLHLHTTYAPSSPHTPPFRILYPQLPAVS